MTRRKFIMKEQLIELLADVSGFEPEDITDDIDFFEEGVLDSFGVVHLLIKIEDTFGKHINIAEIVRDDINTMDKLMAMVQSV